MLSKGVGYLVVVVGLRASSLHFRYCAVKKVGVELTWLNRAGEHYWRVPKAAETRGEILLAVYEESMGILDRYKPDLVIIKVAETVRGHPDPKRVSVESVVILASEKNHVKAIEKRYKDFNTKSSNVKDLALRSFEKCSKNWDAEIADALVAALWGLDR